MPSKTRNIVPVYINQVFCEIETEQLYRVVHTGNEQPYTYLCRIHGSRLAIRRLSTEDFRNMASSNATANGGFVVAEDPYTQADRSERSTPGHDSQSKTNWSYIAPLVSRSDVADRHRFVQLLDGGSARARLCKERAHDAGVVPNVIYRYFRLWLQRGMTSLAVGSGYLRCGRSTGDALYRTTKPAKAMPRNYEHHPGRRGRVAGPQTMLPSPYRDRLFRLMADRYYTHDQALWDVGLTEDLERLRPTKDSGEPDPDPESKSTKGKRENSKPRIRGKTGWNRGRRSRPTAQDVVDRFNFLMRRKRVIKDSDGRVIDVALRQDYAITVHQFRHYLSECNIWRRKRHSMGDARFKSRGRQQRGHALQHCRGPGHVFMIDATVADIYLVSSFDRTIVVGRPTVYFIVDLWSRMIVGLHISFSPPSFEGAALAMQNMVTSKAVFCARYGFNISAADWPCVSMPVRFHCDRGCEYRQSRPWALIATRFGVGIDNSAPYEPFWRGIIERRFGIVPVKAQRFGYAVVESKADAPRAPHYPTDALWTKAEFTRELLRAIHLYHRTPISGTVAEPAMVAHGLPNTPLARWDWGVENSIAMLQVFPPEDVKSAVLFEAQATITAKGLKLNGAYYTSTTISQQYAPVHGRNGKGQVNVRFNPDELDEIRLSAIDEFPEYAVLSPANPIDLRGTSAIEWEQIRTLNAINASVAMQSQEGARMTQALNSTDDRHAAQEEQRAALKAKGRSRPDAKHIRDAKTTEAAIEREMHLGVNRPQKQASTKQEDAELSPKAHLARLNSAAGLRILGASKYKQKVRISK
ncbi:Integrase core domain-containing protein [Burkholderia sp. D7]|nr:Integrase core domain-containing protein [Burkholderia sp. D7]